MKFDKFICVDIVNWESLGDFDGDPGPGVDTRGNWRLGLDRGAHQRRGRVQRSFQYMDTGYETEIFTNSGWFDDMIQNIDQRNEKINI